MKRIGAEIPCGTSWRRGEPLILLDADRPVLPVKP
jgi:hypothetical protein